jgi:hypothetical protein
MVEITIGTNKKRGDMKNKKTKQLVRTFSRVYPKRHRREGERTFFIEKILAGKHPGNDFFPCHCDYCGGLFMSCLSTNFDPALPLDKYQTQDYQVICPFCWGDCISRADIDTLDFYSNNIVPKHHTIRDGEHLSKGDIIIPRAWSAKPYASKQLHIDDSIIVTSTHKFEMNLISRPNYKIDGKSISNRTLDEVVKNDGLDSVDDFENWFCCGQPLWRMGFFTGQIICWNKEIKY